MAASHPVPTSSCAVHAFLLVACPERPVVDPTLVLTATEDLSPKTTVQRHVGGGAGAGVAEGGGANGFGREMLRGMVGWAAVRVTRKSKILIRRRASFMAAT
jgi:hypothetical protein